MEKINLTSFATAVSKGSKSTGVSFAQVDAFLAVCKEQGLRISYGALTVLARDLGLDPVNGFNIHQRGAALVKKLAVEVQPYVTRKDGKYASEAILAWGNETAQKLLKMPVIQDDQVLAAFAATVKKS